MGKQAKCRICGESPCRLALSRARWEAKYPGRNFVASCRSLTSAEKAYAAQVATAALKKEN
jgi:hypothetical protein